MSSLLWGVPDTGEEATVKKRETVWSKEGEKVDLRKNESCSRVLMVCPLICPVGTRG